MIIVEKGRNTSVRWLYY